MFMSVFNSTPPKIKKNHLIKWLNQNYIFLNKHKLLLKNLDSERDKNYLVTLNNKKKYVLKISNALETKKVIELQDYVLSSLNKRPSINKLIPIKIHNKIKSYIDQNISKCYVRILSFI